MTLRIVSLIAVFAVASASPGSAFAWGASGHRMVGVAAMEALPAGLPGFLKTRAAIEDVGELSREPDRSKGAGRAQTVALDPGHFLDVYDDGTIMGGPRLEAMPADRDGYQTALQGAGVSIWKAGWLYYAILETQQQLTRDFALWRVLDHAARTERDPGRRAWYRADLRRREALVLQTAGRLSHYVADGSQPLHVTIHYNGWGDGPNPEGFTRARIHNLFEGDMVVAGVRLADLRRVMPGPSQASVGLESRISGYLASGWREVPTLYRLEKSGALVVGDPRGAAFARDRLAAGAGALRDFIDLAWRDSANARLGWPEITVQDAMSGKADVWNSLYGKD